MISTMTGVGWRPSLGLLAKPYLPAFLPPVPLSCLPSFPGLHAHRLGPRPDFWHDMSATEDLNRSLFVTQLPDSPNPSSGQQGSSSFLDPLTHLCWCLASLWPLCLNEPLKDLLRMTQGVRLTLVPLSHWQYQLSPPPLASTLPAFFCVSIGKKSTWYLVPGGWYLVPGGWYLVLF